MIKYGYIVFGPISITQDSGWDSQKVWRNGYLTVAIDRLEKGGNKYKAAFAWCSPRDSFSKKKGRAIAEGTLIKGKRRNNENEVVEFICEGDWHNVLETAFLDYIGKNSIPSWASKAIRRKTYTFGLKNSDRKYQDLIKGLSADDLKRLVHVANKVLIVPAVVPPVDTIHAGPPITSIPIG